MRYSAVAIAFGLIVAAAPAMATERAYLLIENASGADVKDSLDDDLGSCKALLAGIWPNETIVHLECNELADMNAAVLQMAKVTGVTRATVLTLSK